MCQMCVLSVRKERERTVNKPSWQRWLGAPVHVRESRTCRKHMHALGEDFQHPPSSALPCSTTRDDKPHQIPWRKASAPKKPHFLSSRRLPEKWDFNPSFERKIRAGQTKTVLRTDDRAKNTRIGPKNAFKDSSIRMRAAREV